MRRPRTGNVSLTCCKRAASSGLIIQWWDEAHTLPYQYGICCNIHRNQMVQWKPKTICNKQPGICQNLSCPASIFVYLPPSPVTKKIRVFVLALLPGGQRWKHGTAGTEWPRISFMTSQIMKICYWWSTHSQQIWWYTIYEGITQNTLHLLNDCNTYVYVHDIARMDEHKTLMLSLADGFARNLASLSHVCTGPSVTCPFPVEEHHLSNQHHRNICLEISSLFKKFVTDPIILTPIPHYIFSSTYHRFSKLHPHLGVSLEFLGSNHQFNHRQNRNLRGERPTWGFVANQTSSPHHHQAPLAKFSGKGFGNWGLATPHKPTSKFHLNPHKQTNTIIKS